MVQRLGVAVISVCYGYSAQNCCHQDVNAAKLFSDEAAAVYERATASLLKKNMLLYFAYADFEEGRLKYEKVHQIYSRFLDITDIDPTLVSTGKCLLPSFLFTTYYIMSEVLLNHILISVVNIFIFQDQCYCKFSETLLADSSVTMLLFEIKEGKNEII